MHLKEQVNGFMTKNSILQLKIIEIQDQIAEEKEISKNLDDITPVAFDLDKHNESDATAALASAASQLQKYYNNYKQSDGPEGKRMNNF